ncbi:SMI1/KNR4 family protein [Chitinophaga sp. G-6-1-13]|uniref:SMI1/KNR4 family protein n=1 Tax=Chitinophaga fulva TaxID=2728842 RepID=A0A848GP63_9BACT|nr:SMI1/KNR4 family protein [Chitinophaga fulva]NML40194.1 SMI1/KNR4 family protein [Chitinophaga fulva]
MSNTIVNLTDTLFAETDGNKFATLKDKLIRSYAGKDRQAVIEAFVRYAREGRLMHWRTFLMTDIVRLVAPAENTWRPFFEWAVTEPSLTYWGIDGLLKTAGREAYPTLITLAANEDLPTEQRAKAVKSLAMYSRQPFDRELPSDPGYWKPEQLRLAELVAWQEQGYPDGAGYAPPQVHPSLLHPGNDFEKLMAKLDKLLEKKRRKNKDHANPSDWLVVADEKDMTYIRGRWALPEVYATFLQYYSPLKVTLTGPDFVEGLSLYGARELAERQGGYAYNAVTEENLADWPPYLLVIGDDGADPYCLDLSAAKDGDAPVYTAAHGQGTWDFELYAENFTMLIAKLISGK